MLNKFGMYENFSYRHNDIEKKKKKKKKKNTPNLLVYIFL